MSAGSYGQAALDRECAELSATSAGRNARLNRAAFSLGQLVGAGKIERGDAEHRLIMAAGASNYIAKDGYAAARATIKSGLDRGEQEPRCATQRDAPPYARVPDDESERRREPEKARWLWCQRRPIAGSIAEIYLRQARGYGGPIPPTLAFLPAHEDHAPALIAALGMATEPAPGELAIADEAVAAVQLVKIKPDGSGKADVDPKKIIIGRGALGSPIVIAPPNDLLGLAIVEGIENGLSVHEATGLGVWASGGATRLPTLADVVPAYIDYVAIIADKDASGISGANGLADGLRKRGIRYSIAFLNPEERAA